jgi:alcohol dehydrogenase class IV
MPFDVATASRVVFRSGAAGDIGALVRDLGRRALLVTGRSSERAGRLASLLAAAGVEATTFAVAGEPGVATVQAGVEAARAFGCDLVIGIGGGSAIDAAKAIAVLTPLEADLFDHLEVIGRGRPLPRPGLPCVAVPTTAGTGSEVTRNAVLTSPEHRIKVSLRSSFMLPRLALVDPELTLDLPPALTATTGLDALTQLVEPYVSSRANAFTDALCVDGMPRVARSLLPAFRNGSDRRAREDMSIASLFSGMALANAGLGAVHGFAGTIGGTFGAPHGAICAALLPHVMSGNLRALQARTPDDPVLPRFTTVARLLTGDPGASAEDGVAWIDAIVRELGIPRLGAYGLTPADVPAVAAQAARASSMKANPIQLETEERERMLAAAI